MSYLHSSIDSVTFVPPSGALSVAPLLDTLGIFGFVCIPARTPQPCGRLKPTTFRPCLKFAYLTELFLYIQPLQTLVWANKNLALSLWLHPSGAKSPSLPHLFFLPPGSQLAPPPWQNTDWSMHSLSTNGFRLADYLVSNRLYAIGKFCHWQPVWNILDIYIIYLSRWSLNRYINIFIYI